MKTDTHGLRLSGQGTVQRHGQLRPRPGLSISWGLLRSCGKKIWVEHKMVDESWDLLAKPHPALETILKSGEGTAGRRMNGDYPLPGAFPQEMLGGSTWGPEVVVA